MRIDLYLFYREKVIAQLKKKEKNDRSPYSFTCTSLENSGHEEKATMFLMCMQLRSVLQYYTVRNDLKLLTHLKLFCHPKWSITYYHQNRKLTCSVDMNIIITLLVLIFASR